MCHLVSEGKKVAKEEYKTRRHDNVSKTLHWKLCELTKTDYKCIFVDITIPGYRRSHKKEFEKI